MRSEFLLDPEVVFLNHGSVGACPRPVFERYQSWQRELKRQPVEFLARRLPDLLAEARAKLAAFLDAHADDLVFVPNATSGANLAALALRLEPGDGNCHKWMCAPKGAGFLHVRRELQDTVDALIVSWGFGDDATFLTRNEGQPVFARKTEPLLRFSVAPYTEESDLDALLAALPDLLRAAS